MRSPAAILVLLAFSKSVIASTSDLITATSDLIQCLKLPTQVSVLSCWNESDKLRFWREINSYTTVRFFSENQGNLPWNDPHQHQNLLMIDAGCSKSKELLQSAGQLLYNRVKWIIINRINLNCTKFLKFFDDLQVMISNEVYYICEADGFQGFAIKQVYRLSLATEVIDETFGFWNKGMIVNLQNIKQSSVRRRNLNGLKLRASVVVTHNETLKHLEDYREKHVDTITKMNYILTKYLAQDLNATLKFSYVNTWGYRHPETGKFNGMIGELKNDLADLGATALFLTADRIKEIDYLSMTTQSRVKFIFRSPKLSFTDNVFLLPFSAPVWICIISFIVISGVLLLIIMKVELRCTNVRYGNVIRPNVMDTVMNMFGTSCQQGSYLKPKSLPSKCLILLSLIILMFLYASYSANIVALIQSPSNKIRTLEDLLNSRLGTGAEDTVYNRYYFMVISETFQEDEKCGLQEIEYLNIIEPYYAVQKNSSFRELVRLSLFRLREFGIQDREHSMLYTRKPTCSGGSSFIPVSIVDVWPALTLLTWASGFAGGLLAGETIWARIRARRDLAKVANGDFCG